MSDRFASTLVRRILECAFTDHDTIEACVAIVESREDRIDELEQQPPVTYEFSAEEHDSRKCYEMWLEFFKDHPV